MDLGLSGKKALVTGSTKEIGCAVVETLLNEGASVAICARSVHGDWNMIKDNMADFYAATEKTHPGGSLGDVNDVANAVAFMCSPAAKHINGSNLTVDGGFMKSVNY